MRVILSLIGCLAIASLCHAQTAGLIAELKKDEKQQLAALQALESLGPKAAEATPILVELLNSKSEDIRLGATLVLGQIGAPAVEPVTRALASKTPEVRFYAIWALALMGPQAKAATKEILSAMSDSSPEVRRKAGYALGRVGASAEDAVPALIQALNDSDVDVGVGSAGALERFGKVAVPPLIDLLNGAATRQRSLVVATLGKIGAAAEPAIPHLKKLLFDPKATPEVLENLTRALAGIGVPALPTLQLAAEHDNATLRAQALNALAKVGAPAVPTLVDLLGAKQVDVRRQSAYLLQSLQVRDKMVVIGLGYALKDPDVELRRIALQVLQGMGTTASLAEPYVSAALVDPDPQVRVQAFQTLRSLGVDPQPGLKKALGHADATVRINTASLMVDLNLELALAEPILKEGLKSSDIAVKTQAATALAKRGLAPEVVLPVYLEGLTSSSVNVKRQAALGISKYGVKASDKASSLLPLLDDKDDSVRAAGLSALRLIRAEPKLLFPVMVKILKKPNDLLHDNAAQAIYQMGPGAAPELIALLREEKAPALRLVCLQSLSTIGPAAKEGLDALKGALGESNPRARVLAARAIGNLGPAGKAALDDLAKLEKDSDATVRQIAQAARSQIQAADAKTFTADGVLTKGDPFDRVRPQCHHVVTIFPMKAGQVYQMDLISAWDNFLRVENEVGEQLAFDDDSGNNANAKLAFRAPGDGWYRIIVTSYGPGVTGNYKLTIANK